MADDKTDASNQRKKDSDSKPGASSSTQKELLSEIKETLIAQSANLGDSLGRDTINVRRHLLEMKNMTAEQLENQKALNKTFGAQAEDVKAKAEGESVKNLDEAEERDDMQTIFEDIRDSLKAQPEALAKSGSAESGKMAKGLMGGMGKMLGGLGIGIGAAGVGAAAMIGAGAYLLSVLDDIDAKKIKDNVAELLSMNDILDKDGKSFIGETGAFYITMLGVGAGLLAFSIGAGAANVVDKFERPGWTERLKENVKTLLSISDELGGAGEILKDGGAFFLAMTGLGLGLAAFAIGTGAAAVAGSLSTAVETFITGDNWAERVKTEVITLLSISKEVGGAGEMLKDGGAFFLAMTGLGLGLAAFAIGKAGSGVADAFTLFQGKNFAEDIKKEVVTLLSISKIEGIGWDTAKFIAVMGGLAAGLVAFSVGKGASGAADMLTWTQGKNFAEDIKKEVGVLLTIGDLLGPDTAKKSTDAMKVLGTLGTGLAAFGAGTFVAALGQAGAAILNFFSEGESPLDQALRLADNSERIDKGVESLQGFKNILDDFSSMGDISFEMDTEQMAEDLLGATKIFELALEGGEIPEWGFNTKVKGLLNIQGIDTVTEEINLLKSLFAPVNTTGLELNAAGNPALAAAGPTAVDQSTFAPTSLSTTTTVTNLASLHPTPTDGSTAESLKIG